MKKSMTIFLILSVTVLLTACMETRFNGDRTGNDSQFIMNYSIFNGTDYQLLELEAGDIVDVKIVSDSGTLNIKVTRDGYSLFNGNGVQTGTFQLTIPESGTYKFEVTGKKAKGSVSFIKSTSENNEKNTSFAQQAFTAKT